MKQIRYCSFKNCKTKSSDDKVMLFSMPKDPGSQKEWKQFFCLHNKRDVTETKNLKLCQHHFRPNDINNLTVPPRLKKGSIPRYVDIRFEPVEEEYLDIDEDLVPENEFEHPEVNIPTASSIFETSSSTFETSSNTFDTSSSTFKTTSKNIQILSHEKSSCDDYVLNTLLKDIKNLQIKAKAQEQLIRKLKRSDKELKSIRAVMAKYYGKDQIDVMCGKKVKFSNGTVQKGLILRYKLGKQFYEGEFRKKYCPGWPSTQTCLQRIKNFKIPTGILKFNTQILGIKLEKLPENYRSVGLIFDEKAIVPSIQKDNSIHQYRGKATLLPSRKIREKEGDEPLAKHALVVLAVGMNVREKEIVGLEYTAGTSDGKAMKEFIESIIKYVEENTSCFVDWIGFDLSPSNQSMLKEFGVSLSHDNEIFKIPHPYRPGSMLYLESDMAHDEKNIISALRRANIKISPSLVKKANLNTNVASFDDVRRIFKRQQRMDIKMAKNLKQEHINPTQFEKMKQRIASDVLSTDVSSVIEFLDIKSTENGKKNATAWMLQNLQRLHNIIFDKEGWSSLDKAKYESDKYFLKWIGSEFLPNLKFSNALRCIAGLKLSINSLLELTEEYFKRGFVKVVPAFFLNDAIENIFSLVTSIVKKPTAVTMAQALRVISVNQFQFNPISRNNCSWDENAPTSIDFIELLNLFAENEIDTENDEDDSTADRYFVEITDIIDGRTIFATDIDYNVFFCEISRIFNKLMARLDCDECKNNLINSSGVQMPGSDLFELRNQIEEQTHGQGILKYQPSKDILTFYMRLEFIFKELAKLISPDKSNFQSIYMYSTEKVLIANEHCYKTTALLISTYIKERLDLNLHKYLPHKSNKNASKSLV